MYDKLKNLGPGILITAAFIGPGTVTICSVAGYRFGFALLWALVFSIATTIILQGMAARLGLITQKGLAEAIRSQIKHPVFSWIAVLLVLAAILIGNTAYEAGNISGAVLGMDTVFGAKQFWIGSMQVNVWSVLIGGIAIILLMSGSYKVIEKAMIVLVILMSILFLITAIIIGPPILQIVNGMFIPTIPSKSILTIVGLIGTTVVPYNLFLHASAVSKRWHKKEDLSIVRFDTFVSIILGGIISMAIIITSAGALGSISNIADGSDLAVQLEPLLGEWAKYCLAGGLFAAGITSSITAPLAAAFATAGILGKPTHLTHPLFRGVMVIIIVIGIIFSSLRYSPVTIIQFAQFANGLLLPVIGIFLVWIMNRKELLGAYINTRIQNILGLIVIGVTILLGMKSIGAVLGLF